MKKINKTNPPRSFISMMTHNKSSNWEDFHTQCQDVFNDCVDSLKVEQDNLDGYTENPGDLSWDAIRAFGEVTVYDRTPYDDEEIARRIGDAEVVFTNNVFKRIFKDFDCSL